MSETKKLKGKFFITATLVCDTGLHIGGNKDSYNIGDVDNPVIKDALTNMPYIPGSSLKGKMRSLLEELKGVSGSEPCKCSSSSCPVCVLFGPHGEDKKIKPHLIVRDAKVVEDEYLKKKEYVEIKMENTIDRWSGTSSNLRDQERVIPGTKFETEFIISVWEGEEIGGDKRKNEEFLIHNFFKAMKQLEDDYLGGSGTRGYGKVHFENIQVSWRPAASYETGEKQGGTVSAKNLSEAEAKSSEMIKLVNA
ncbi:MAG: type III-A CRISPR-associated RAMP protein Csm3 [Candidatus Micrarchaeia archaeon]